MNDVVVPIGAVPAEVMGPKMSALTEKQRRFVWAYILNGGDGAGAARQAGYSDSSDACKVRAHTLLHQDSVLQAMHEVAWKSMRGLSMLAVFKLRRALEADGHPDQMKAVFGVLNRIGFGEKVQVEHHHSGSIELNHTDAALEALAYLKSMQVPREKLIEQFGSGLSRYERMLEERDRKMKVIEHEPEKVFERPGVGAGGDRCCDGD